MSADLARMRAARAKAEEIAASLDPMQVPQPGPRLRIAITDPETNQRLATAFVSYEVPAPAPQSCCHCCCQNR